MYKKSFFALSLALGALMVVLQPGPFSAIQSKIMPSVQHYLSSSGQEKVKVWVYFKDHGERSGVDLQRALQDVQLSDRALRRRMNRSGAPVVDVADLPVNPSYIDNLAALGLRIRRLSKYLNAVSAEATASQIRQAANLSFVKKIDRVFTLRRRPPADSGKEIDIPVKQYEPSVRAPRPWRTAPAAGRSNRSTSCRCTTRTITVKGS